MASPLYMTPVSVRGNFVTNLRMSGPAVGTFCLYEFWRLTYRVVQKADSRETVWVSAFFDHPV